MTKLEPEPTGSYAVYVIRFTNSDGSTGHHVKTCRASELRRKIQRYQMKIMKRQLRLPFQNLLRIECVHSFEGTHADVKQARLKLLADPTHCPECGGELGSDHEHPQFQDICPGRSLPGAMH